MFLVVEWKSYVRGFLWGGVSLGVGGAKACGYAAYLVSTLHGSSESRRLYRRKGEGVHGFNIERNIRNRFVEHD